MKFDYEVALSFAGEDREYVEKVAEILKAIGIQVFYDKYEEVDLWGKNLYTHLDDIYQKKSKYCIMFISKHYKEKLWTNHERESAQARAFESKEEYILPAKLDDTEIPGIRKTIGYINIEKLSPEDFAYKVAKKIRPDIDVQGMIKYLKEWLKDYDISIKGINVVFKSELEDYYGEFSLRLLIEMYMIDELDRMFLIPAIVPY
ncbi:toll/interleukin-1 receptor domain-containing protein [Clostridium niameyense]|uniref:toll/interleukin-1 receptor domain-containing protein n=1 Tax=Clostridium niameyense TaxID=1622073 RepID=UPI00067F49D0|nr:TIR domain-containing protein [Clostridium niameyense]